MVTDQFRLKAPSAVALWPKMLTAYIPSPKGVVMRFAVDPFGIRLVGNITVLEFGGGAGLYLSTSIAASNPVGPVKLDVVTVRLVI
jgi:hypothetical protein